jgi:TolB-like protein/DNA-binding winged helix-turn-helix (wHTH) protein/Tfp pilus assembly protein PilF
MPMMANFAPETGASRIDLAETSDFDLGGLRVSPSRREVRMNGERRELEPRVAQVLVALAAARSEVVSRDRLIEQCWEGRIVGDDSINRCIVALRHLSREFSPEPFTIETVARVGYSLVERRGDEVAQAPRVGNRRAKLAVAFLAVLLLLVAAGAWGWSRFGRAEAAPASIAVLSFRNLSPGDPYFAQGVGEEILGQLAREPQFRVLGRTSSGDLGKAGDVREIARRLEVDYVLDGSVRTQGDRVRVNAALLKASDGSRFWSDSYDGKLDDIFAIQQRIGGAIALALRRKLVRAPVLSGPLVTSGEAYNLYLTARGLIKTRQRAVGGTAVGLLRDAIRLDPGYAPAWASLATATQLEGALNDHESFVPATSQARLYARRALQLAPDLAEAHLALAQVLGDGTAESQAHFRRAAELDPGKAENMIGLGFAHASAGEFEQQLAANRRAVELDPSWFRTTGSVVIALADMGDRAEAEAVARRSFPNNQVQQHILLGRIAWIFGDFSEAARHWSFVARANSPRWSETGRRTMTDATFAVGLRTGPLVAVPQPLYQRHTWRIWMDSAPSPAVWRARNRDGIAADVYRDENHVAAKLMLNAGRTRELAAPYDGPVGLLGFRPGQAVRVDQLGETPLAALVLRQAGRAAEADRLLREADAAARAVYRRGRVPFWFDAEAAALWAVQGRSDEALTMLEHALGRGWTHSGSTDLRDITDEPAFRSLHGQPRFERIRMRLDAHYARERRETEALHI